MFKRRDSIEAALIGLAAVAYTWFFFDRGVDLFDEGLYATEASRILDGGVYGRDFLAPYGPGRYYLIAGLFGAFGASLKVQAALFVALRGLVASLFYTVSRQVLPRSLSVVLAVAVTLAHGALHKSFFQFAVLACITAWFAYRRSQRPRACLCAGLVCGFVALFRVDAGLFGAVSFLTLLALELVWDRPAATLSGCARKVGAFLAGAALPALPVAAAVWLTGDLETVLRSEIQRTVNLVRFADTVAVPSIGQALADPSLKRILLSIVIPAAPAALIALGAMALYFRIRGGRGTDSLEILAVALFGLPVLNQLRITPTFNHLLQSVPLALLAATLVIDRLLAGFREGSGPVRKGLCAAVVIVPAAILVFYNLAMIKPDTRVPGSIRSRWSYDTPIPLDRAGLYEKAEVAFELQRVVAAIEAATTEDDAIFTGPYTPALHFLSCRKPAVPYLEPFYYFRSEKAQTEMIDSLERSRPVLVVLGGPVRSVGGQSLERDAPMVERYIRLRYEPFRIEGRYRLMKRIE